MYLDKGVKGCIAFLADDLLHQREKCAYLTHVRPYYAHLIGNGTAVSVTDFCFPEV
jgi:hypothetical protein